MTPPAKPEPPAYVAVVDLYYPSPRVRDGERHVTPGTRVTDLPVPSIASLLAAGLIVPAPPAAEEAP